jgi:hypothetical protein
LGEYGAAGVIRTCGDVVEGDAGAGEGVLDGVGDAVGVSVGGDGDGAGVAGGGEGGTHVLGDEVGIAAAGDLAVLDVPPHRGLHRCVFRHSRRRRPPAPVSPARRRGVGGFFMVCDADGGVEVALKEGIVFSVKKKCCNFAAKWRAYCKRGQVGFLVFTSRIKIDTVSLDKNSLHLFKIEENRFSYCAIKSNEFSLILSLILIAQNGFHNGRFLNK